MIKLYERLPQIYYHKSRDFQFLARTYEVLFNYLKTNVDVTESLVFNENFDVSLLNLLALTLGFTSKHNYNTRDLFNLCSSFAKILRNKGSMKSIEDTIKILLNAQRIEKTFSVDFDSEDKYNLLIYITSDVKDLVLLEDVFDYILPCGYTYSFIKTDVLQDINSMKLKTASVEKHENRTVNQLGQVANYNKNTSRFTYTEQPTDLSQTSTGVVVTYDKMKEEE